MKTATPKINLTSKEQGLAFEAARIQGSHAVRFAKDGNRFMARWHAKLSAKFALSYLAMRGNS